MDKQALIKALHDMEDFALLKQLQCPPIYLADVLSMREI